MGKIPKKIDICPIEEAIFEVRFSTNFPSGAIFGIIFSAVKDLFPDSAVHSLQAQQIPEQIREKDPALRYQALQRMFKENLSLSIGPHSLVFANSREYVGWKIWSEFFHSILERIRKTEILTTAERIGLRYVNVFPQNILENSNIEFNLNEIPILQETCNLRTELQDEGYTKILQVGNRVRILSKGNERIGSVIDVDCLYSCENLNFFDNYKKLVDEAHNKEKELFFSLLTEDFIQTLKPHY